MAGSSSGAISGKSKGSCSGGEINRDEIPLAEQQYENSSILYLKPGVLNRDRVNEIDAKLRATRGLPGKQIYERLRSLEGETGVKFPVLDRRRKLLLKDDEDSSRTDQGEK